jgi:hypothetical protein
MTIDELKQFIEDNRDNYAIQLKRHYLKMYDEINGKYEFNTFGQKLYHFIYGDDNGKCEMCGTRCKFDGIHKGYRKRCSYSCMGRSKYNNSHESRQCAICGAKFEIYKNREKTTCSNECLLELNRSDEVNNKRVASLKVSLIQKYGVSHPSKIPGFAQRVRRTKKKHYNDETYVNVKKSRATRLERYGDENYTNQSKIKETCMERYGIPNVLCLKKNKTNGKQISKFQRREYDRVLMEHPDAQMEEYLPDVQKSVDIYIPSQRKIVECFGDFWHCNPAIYDPNYYHKYVHMNASEIWKRDEERIKALESAGYTVEIIWENVLKHNPRQSVV